MKERTIKELLKLMLNNIHLLDTGLCWLIVSLRAREIITHEESYDLENYLDNNAPNERCGGWWFGLGLKQPRIKWLQQEIKKLEQ